MVYQLWPGAILDISILSGLSQYKLICFFATIHHLLMISVTAQKVKFSIKGFFSKCDQIRSFLWIWSHLLTKSLMINFTFCAVIIFGKIELCATKAAAQRTKLSGEKLKKIITYRRLTSQRQLVNIGHYCFAFLWIF